ncbi:MAG: cation:proton antiporter, partial [Candidatus Thorarchaeota archaeon]
FIGILAGRAAEIYKFPKMIPLILTGLLITIIATITQIELELEAIQELTLLISEIALIIVLYNEGMHLDLRAFSSNFLPIFILALFGTFLTSILVGVTIITLHFVSISFLTALLIGAIVAPTDPAATFSILRGGGTRVKEHLETILGGESALNDALAILLVIIIIVPQLVLGTEGINFSPALLLLGLWSVTGGVLLGIIVGVLSIFFISLVKSKSEISFVSLLGMFLIFAVSTPLGTSSAIAALICGIIIRNPKLIKSNVIFDRIPIFNFWQDVTFLFEILAFVFIGVLIDLDILLSFLPQGVIISVIVLLSRVVVVFITTMPLELTQKSAEMLSNKERIFIGLAGFKGLTTAILATYAFVNLESLDPELAGVLLFSSLLVILFTGTFQGLILRPLAARTEAVEEMSELDELLVQKLALEVKLEKLVNDRSSNHIKASDFRKLSLPIKEELYIVEDRIRLLQTKVKSEKLFIQYQIELLEKTLETLEDSYDQGEIQYLAYNKVKRKYEQEIAELMPHLNGVSSSEVHQEVQANKLELAEVDVITAYDTLESLAKDPKIAKKIPELNQIQTLLKKAVKKITPRSKGNSNRTTRNNKATKE